MMFIMSVFVDILRYIFHPRVVLTNVIAVGLLYDIRRLHGPKVTLAVLAIEELVTLILWLLIPNSWATFISIFIAIVVYEQIRGPKVNILEDAIFYCDEHPREIFKEKVNIKTFPLKLGYGIQTDLKYAAYSSTTWQRTDRKSKLAIDIDTVSRVCDGCDPHVSGAVRRIAQIETCFYLVIGNLGDTVTFITPSTSVRQEWASVLNQYLTRLHINFDKLWTEQLCEKVNVCEESTVKLDEAVNALNSANRAADKVYAKEIINSILKQSGLKSSSDPVLSKEHFLRFLQQASNRPDIIAAFQWLQGPQKEMFLRAIKFHGFLRNTQKENVTLHTAKLWIKASEPILPGYNLSPMGFTNFLLREEQVLFCRDFKKVYQDMTQPMSHYFIATSHNTYLTKDQFKSKSSIDMYIQAFKRGCKCVEVDCWDGANNEPVIYHGHTLTSKIKFVDVIKAVRDHAFAVSEYPVILSFENHCSVEQQKVMAKHLVEILGDRLYTKEVPEDEKALPSPEALKGYVIVKNKKLKEGVDETQEDDDDFSDEEINQEDLEQIIMKVDEEKEEERESENGNEDTISEAGSDVSRKSKLKSKLSDIRPKRSSSKKKAAKIAPELSYLIAYCRAVPFKGFDYAMEKYEHYEMSSFGEKKAFKLAKDNPLGFLRYTRRHFARSYPAGGRVDSSNYEPTALWNVGVQMAALNYQTGAFPMQLNQGLFLDNGACGYVLKPHFMRTDTLENKFDPRGPFDENLSTPLKVKIISGFQLPYKSDSNIKKERELSVHVRISGVEADVQKLRTKQIKNNGYNPMWNEELSLFIHVPELALVTFNVIESKDNFLAQYTLPFRCMQQGYRCVPLKNKNCEAIAHASLFVCIEFGKS